jgi:hypothetical protein
MERKGGKDGKERGKMERKGGKDGKESVDDT